MDPLLIKSTHTTKFLLPLVVKDDITYKDIQSCFIESYLSDDKYLNNTDQINIFIVLSNIFELSENKILSKFKDNYTDNYIDVESPNKEEIFVYTIEDNDLEDYFNFLIGEYHNFKEEFKQKILKFWDATENSLLYKILYNKIDDLQEYIKNNMTNNNPFIKTYNKVLSNLSYSKPDLTKEIYGLNRED